MLTRTMGVLDMAAEQADPSQGLRNLHCRMCKMEAVIAPALAMSPSCGPSNRATGLPPGTCAGCCCGGRTEGNRLTLLLRESEHWGLGRLWFFWDRRWRMKGQEWRRESEMAAEGQRPSRVTRAGPQDDCHLGWWSWLQGHSWDIAYFGSPEVGVVSERPRSRLPCSCFGGWWALERRRGQRGVFVVDYRGCCSGDSQCSVQLAWW